MGAALKSAGYVERKQLAEIEKENNKSWLYAFCGAVLGFLLIPIPGGLIIGALLGFWLGRSDKNETTPRDYDYTQISEGSTWKSTLLMWLLIAGCLFYAVLWIIDLVK